MALHDALVVRETADRGRGVFAERELPAGELLMRALPAVAVLNDECFSTNCCICFRRLQGKEQPVPCSRCSSYLMCKRCSLSKCAKSLHADECDALQALGRAPQEFRPADTRSLRLLMRLLLFKWRDAQDEDTVQSQESQPCDGWWGDADVCADGYDDICGMASPELDSLPDHLVTAFMNMSQQARYFLWPYTRTWHEQVVQLLARLYCNSLTIYGLKAQPSKPDDGLVRGEIGVAVSTSVALLNHSCEPNADWEMDEDGCILVRTLRHVRAGQELCLTYVDPHLPAARRRELLQDAFFFTCSCAGCSVGGSAWSCTQCGHANPASAQRCEGKLRRSRCKGQQWQQAPRGCKRHHATE